MSVVNLRFFFLCSLFKVFFFATCSAFCALSLLFRKIFLCRSSNLCGGLCFNEVIFFIPPASFFFSSFIHCCRLFWGGEVHLRGGGAGSIFFAKSPKNPSAPFWPPMHVVGHFQVKKCPFWGAFGVLLVEHLVEQVPSNFLLRHKLHRKTCVLRRRLWKRSFCGVPVFNKQWARCNLRSFFSTSESKILTILDAPTPVFRGRGKQQVFLQGPGGYIFLLWHGAGCLACILRIYHITKKLTAFSFMGPMAILESFEQQHLTGQNVC